MREEESRMHTRVKTSEDSLLYPLSEMGHAPVFVSSKLGVLLEHVLPYIARALQLLTFYPSRWSPLTREV